jgi:hypothetical protein
MSKIRKAGIAVVVACGSVLAFGEGIANAVMPHG